MKFFSFIFLTFLLILHSNALNLNEICYGILFEAIPHPDDPNLFIGCVQGRGTIFGCENIDDVFDPVTISCVDPSTLTTTTEWDTTTDPDTETQTETEWTDPITNGTTISTSTTSITTPPPCGGVGVSFVCPTDGSPALIPSPDNCDRYFECILGVANMRFCPSGKNFDVITRQCIDPDVAFCGNLIRCV